MRKFLLVPVAVSLLAIVAIAATDRDGLSQREVIVALNGASARLGVAHSVDGGPSFSTCVNTATPFDAGFGNLVLFTCTDPVYAHSGICSSAAVSTSRPVAANTDIITFLSDDDMAIAFLQQDGGSSASCYVGHLQ